MVSVPYCCYYHYSYRFYHSYFSITSTAAFGNTMTMTILPLTITFIITNDLANVYSNIAVSLAVTYVYGVSTEAE